MGQLLGIGIEHSLRHSASPPMKRKAEGINNHHWQRETDFTRNTTPHTLASFPIKSSTLSHYLVVGESLRITPFEGESLWITNTPRRGESFQNMKHSLLVPVKATLGNRLQRDSCNFQGRLSLQMATFPRISQQSHHSCLSPRGVEQKLRRCTESG